VQKTISIPKGIRHEEVITAIAIEQDGTVRHAATKVIEVNGAFYAVITSFTNATYTLVWNDVKFKDVENHWSKEYVNEMGSRLIVNGVGRGIFNPNNDITRAELAAMIIRALGIKTSDNSEKFVDVAEGLWYSEVINCAREYGIITGYTDNTFRPMQKVTREESIAMISRAMKLLGVENNLADDEIEQLLQTFEDGNKFASWSRKHAAYAIKNKLVLGSGGKLMPHNNITRAEAAAIILRVLRNSGVI